MPPRETPLKIGLCACKLANGMQSGYWLLNVSLQKFKAKSVPRVVLRVCSVIAQKCTMFYFYQCIDMLKLFART
jgi:hypothetical protein